MRPAVPDFKRLPPFGLSFHRQRLQPLHSEDFESGPFPLTIVDGDIESADWELSGPHELPVGSEIRIEWCFSGTGGTTADWMGWYIDDVVVRPVIP